MMATLFSSSPGTLCYAGSVRLRDAVCVTVSARLCCHRSRGHHGDIGGIAPGSMPPNSKLLQEEGAAIVKFKLVTGGRFQEEGITELLMAPGMVPRIFVSCEEQA